MTINRLEILYRVGKQLQDCTHARLARAELKPVWTDFESDGNAKWTLDLSSTALFELIFQGWGLKHPRIEVLCDESKPLLAVSEHFDGFVGREEHLEITEGLRKVPVRANLLKPIAFGTSADHPTLQIADLVAGLTLEVMMAPDDPANGNLRGWVAEHMHENYVLPNPSLADIRKLQPRVNFAVLQELARRADIGADPLQGMQDFYAGALKRFRNPATRLARPAPKRRR